MDNNALKFEDMDQHINADLQEKLHRAQDEVNDKEAQIEGLKGLVSKAKSALDVDRKALDEATGLSRTAHQGHGGDAKALEAATTKARKVKGAATAKVQEGQERIDDLEQGLDYATRELVELQRARDLCRHQVMRGLMLATKFPQRPGEKARLLAHPPISVEDMVMAFILHMEMGPGGANPFAGEFGHPNRMFAFIAQYFAIPNADDFAAMRSRFEAKVWGGYEVPTKGGRGPIPKGSFTPPYNWELMGSGLRYST